MGSNPIGALYKHCFYLTFFIPYIEKHGTKKHQMYYETYFWKADYLLAIFSSLKISRRRGNFVERETNLAQGHGKKRDPGVGFITDYCGDQVNPQSRSGESAQGESRLADELCKVISKAQSLYIKQRFAKGAQRNITDFLRPATRNPQPRTYIFRS